MFYFVKSTFGFDILFVDILLVIIFSRHLWYKTVIKMFFFYVTVGGLLAP